MKGLGIFKLRSLLVTPIFLITAAAVSADELPKRLFGTWQFTSTAGAAIIGELAITKNYVAYGSSLNGVCSDSYKVKKLLDSNDYPDSEVKETRNYVSYRTYRLILDNPDNCAHKHDTLQISFEQVSTIRSIKSYPADPKFINKISLVTYKGGKKTGWFPRGFKLTEYLKQPESW